MTVPCALVAGLEIRGGVTIDTQALRVFVDLAEDLHFARTSARHNMSSSTLSRLVRRLEEEVGTPLFERSNRHVALTEAGQEYLVFARESLQRWQLLRKQLGEAATDPGGIVSLYCSVTASYSLLDTIMTQLRNDYPRIEVKLHTGDQALSVERLHAGTEDMVIAAQPEQPTAQLLFKSLARSQLLCIGPKANSPVTRQLQQLNSTGIARWHELPWIVAERGLSRQRWQRLQREFAAKPSVYAQVTGHEAIVSMVALGCGVALVPELVLSSSPLSASIQVLADSQHSDANLAAALAPFDIGLCVLKRRLQEPAVRAVWDAVQPLE